MRLNPTGTSVAFVRGFAERPVSPRIVVRDVATGAERTIAPGRDPRWLDADTVVWRDQETGEIRQARAPEWTAERWGA